MFPRKSGGVATIKLHWQSIFCVENLKYIDIYALEYYYSGHHYFQFTQVCRV